MAHTISPANGTELGAGTAAVISGGIAAVGWGVLLLAAAAVVHLGHVPGWGGFALVVFSLFGFPVPVALAATGAAGGDGGPRTVRVAVRWGLGAIALCAAVLAVLVVQAGIG